MTEPRTATELLKSVSEGSRGAGEELFPIVYDELRRLAASYLASERVGHTLQPTALVHEAYVRLLGGAQPAWNGRAHFFAIAARAMRHTLVNHAKARKAQKRGGGQPLLDVDPALVPAATPTIEAPALAEAIERLAGLDERKARVVEMRFFAGLTMEEIAPLLDVSLSTVEADWRFARAWLARELAAEGT